MDTSLFLPIHAVAGTLALVTFWVAAILRKGTRRHRLAGRVYLVAMCTVMASAAPLAIGSLVAGRPVAAAFLGYLLVLVATTVWLAWRAIRDKAAPGRYLGRTYHALAMLNPLAGIGVLLLGLRHGQPLLVGFSLVGVLVGVDMWRRRRVIPTLPRWWLQEHYAAMVGNGAATHIAFLAIGLPRLVPGMGGMLYYAAWFGPVLLSIVARAWLDRRLGFTRAGGSAAPPLGVAR